MIADGSSRGSISSGGARDCASACAWDWDSSLSTQVGIVEANAGIVACASAAALYNTSLLSVASGSVVCMCCI